MVLTFFFCALLQNATKDLNNLSIDVFEWINSLMLNEYAAVLHIPPTPSSPVFNEAVYVGGVLPGVPYSAGSAD